MFSAFRPSAPLSGGLLWKIPWRLSPAQKLRQRRRLRRVDNVVTTLTTALQNRAALTTATTESGSESSLPSSLQLSSHPSSPSSTSTSASAQDSSRIGAPNPPTQQSLRRHGKGPKQGDYLPNSQQQTLLSDHARQNGTIRLLERWRAEMPREEEMLAKDKYTIFDRKVRGYRKGVHKLPKWTRVSQRLNPPGF